MRKFLHVVLAVLVALGQLSFSTNVRATNRTFVGTVGLVEVRAAMGDFFIMTIHDAAGNNITLCDGVTYTYAMGLPLTDPAAKVIMAIVMSAKLNNLQVTGWGFDASTTGGLVCGIGNLALV